MPSSARPAFRPGPPRSPVALAVAFFAALAACHHAADPAAEEAHPLRVTCVEPSVQRLVRVVDLRGAVEIAPGHHALVAPQVAGRLLSVAVREGDRVARNAPLAEVDARQARDAVTQAQAAVAGAQAGAQNATLTADRTRRLFEHGIAARQELDDADSRLATARSLVTAARASLSSVSRSLAFATVRAPLDGVVLRVLRAAGDLVDGTPGTPVVEVGDPAALDLLASAVPADLVQLRVAQAGTVRFEALPGRTWPVTVRSIAPSIDPAAGVGSVRLALAGGEGAPPIGLAGAASVVVGAQDGVRMIPTTALRGTTSGGSEVLVCERGHLRASEVHLGARDGARVEVLDGVPAGAKLVGAEVLGVADGAAYQEAP
jgi:RND family efflux transporter MFP subunit